MASPISEIAPELLALLRCPETRQALAPASAGVLAQINATRGQPLEAALVREDGRRAYPIRNGIPVLLPDEAIDL